MKKEYDIIIGIDPDVKRSGVAVLDMKTGNMLMYSMSFPELIRWLQEQSEAVCKDMNGEMTAIGCRPRKATTWGAITRPGVR